MLDDYVSYTLVDIIDKAKPELCVVIIVTRLEIVSTKRLLETLSKKLEVGKLHAISSPSTRDTIWVHSQRSPQSSPGST